MIKKSLERATSNYDNTKLLFGSGKLNELELIRAESLVKDQEILLKNAKKNEILALERLNLIVGLEANNNLGDIFPRLNNIYTGKENYEMFSLLKKIQDEHQVETVLPTFTLFNYYTNNENPQFPTDWSKETEMPNSQPYYLKFLLNKKVIIEKGCDTNLCDIVRKNGKKIKENKLFSLYQVE